MPKVKEVLDSAMQKYLGVRVENIAEDVSDLLMKFELPINYELPFKNAKEDFKKRYIVFLLTRHNGAVEEVARISGLKRESIYRLLRSFKIDVALFRRPLSQITYGDKAFVQDVIEQVLDAYKPVFSESKVKEMYKHVPEISGAVAENVFISEPSWKDAEREFEVRYLSRVLKRFDSVASCARMIGLRFETLHRKLKSLNL